MKIFNNVKLVLSLAILLLSSCGDNIIYETEDGNVVEQLNNDTFKQSERQYSDENVSFKFQPYVKFLSEYQLSYLTGIEDDSVLVFSSLADKSKLCQLGDVYAYNKSTEMFPNGFVGKVISLREESNGIKLTTTFVPLDSIFSDFKVNKELDVSQCKIYDELGNEVETTITDEVLNDSDFVYTTTEAEGANYAKSYFNSSSSDVQTRASINYTIRAISRNLTFLDTQYAKSSGSLTISGNVYVNVDMLNDYACVEPSIKLQLKGTAWLQVKASAGFDQTKKEIAKIYVPVPNVPLVNIPLTFYGYTTYDANIKLEAGFDIGIAPKLRLELKNNKFTGTATIGASKKDFLNGNVKFSGKLGFGMGIRAFLGFGIAQWKLGQMESAYVDGHATATASTSVDLINSNDGYTGNMGYQGLSNANVKLEAQGGFYAERKGFLKIFGNKVNKNNGANEILSKKDLQMTLATLYLLPNPSAWAKQITNNDAKITYKLSRAVLLPVSYGMSLFKDGKKIETRYAANKTYWVPNIEDSFNFSFLDAGVYQVYPAFKLAGLEVIGNQPYDFSIKDNGHINSLKHVTSSYSFRTNNVKFEYDINATVENLTNIQEWGVYIEVSDGKYEYFKSNTTQVNTPTVIRVQKEYNKNDFDKIDKNSYVATKNIKCGVYTKNGSKYNRTSIQNLAFTYSHKPKAYYTKTEYIESKPYTEPNDHGWDTSTGFYSYVVTDGGLFVDKVIEVLYGNWLNPGKSEVRFYNEDNSEEKMYTGVTYKKPGSGTSCRSIELICGNNTIKSDNYVQYISNGSYYSTLSIMNATPSYAKRQVMSTTNQTSVNMPITKIVGSK